MRVWLVNHYAVAPGDPGGTRHFTLAKELIASGHDVTIIASSFNYVRRSERADETPAMRRETIDGVPFIWLRTPPYSGNTVSRMKNMLSFAWRAWRSLRSRALPRPDVIFGSSPHLFAALAAERLAARHRVPFVPEIRDIWPQSLVDLGNISPRHPMIVAMRAIEKRLYRRAARIVSVLPGAVEHIAASGGVRDHVVWIPNGVDVDSLPEVERPAPCETFTAIYAGAHGLANQLDTLLDAAAVVRDRGAGDRILIRLVGDGPEKPRLQQRAADEGLTNVSFGDVVPKSQVPSLLRGADACIVNLQDSPVFRWGVSPNKLFDYMAAARPILFSVRTPYDPVRDAGAGLSIEPGSPGAMADALLQLAAMSPDERWQMGLRGRAYVEQRHDLRRLAGTLESTLAAAVEERR